MNVTTPKDHIYQIEKPNKMNKKNIIILTIVIVLVILGGYFWGAKKIVLAPSSNLKETADQQKDSSPTTSSSAKIIVTNQIPGEVVLVAEVNMAEAGWVAIHDNNDGKPGNILGAGYLPSGTYINQMIPLLRGVVDGSSYLAIIHKDDGDKIFDYKIDTPVTNSLGQIETASFDVVAESSRGE